MPENMRKTGINVVGDVPWGTHFCQFYQTKEDLLDILIPYFKTGLESNEFCMWVVSYPLTVKEAEEALKEVLPNLEFYRRKKQIEIVPYTEWYLKDGVFKIQRVLNGWVEKLNSALAKGCDGLRLTGNTVWLEEKDWRDFSEYEEEIDNIIGRYQMMAICSYLLNKCGAYEIIDVVRNHQFALIKREGKLMLFESSERKRTREELRKSEEKYRDLYETIKDGLVSVGLDGHILDCNQAYLDMLGYTREEVTKLTYQQITPAKWHEIEKNIVENQIMLKGYSDEYEKEYIKKDGTVFPVSLRVWLVKDEQRRYKGMWGIVRDVAERKQFEKKLNDLNKSLEMRILKRTKELTIANKKLRESENKYRFLIENLPLRIFYKDRNSTYISCNENLARDFHIKPEEITGKTDYDFFPKEIAEEYIANDREVIKSGQRRDIERKYIKDGQEFVFHTIKVPIKNEKGNIIGILGSSLDITEKVSLEREAQQSRHLALIGEIAAGVTHEINNPINGIINYSQILLNKSIEGSMEKDLARRILQEGNRIATIVNKLLSFARPKEKKTITNIHEIVSDTLVLMEKQLKKDCIVIKLDVPKGLPEIYVNPQEIQQVFMNLISNARYALNQRYPKGHENKVLEISCENTNLNRCHYVQVIFYDRGTGIPANIKNKIMNPFFTTKPHGKGTGLGLSISHSIVNDYKGRITIDSIEGEYTKVIVTLPVYSKLSQEIVP